MFAVPPLPEVTDPARNGLGRNGGKHVHGAGLAVGDVTTWFGVPVTTVGRTLVDLARHDRRDGLIAADAALHERRITQVDIDAALGEAAGWPGVRQARQILALADHRAESPLESLARLALYDDGIPLPDLQVEIGGDRVDMVFHAQRVILEVDGLDKYRRTTMAAEKRRERRLRRYGYRVERLTWNEVVRDWDRTRRWLRPVLGLPL